MIDVAFATASLRETAPPSANTLIGLRRLFENNSDKSMIGL